MGKSCSVKFEPCCKEVLKNLRDRQEAGAHLRRFLLAGPFALMFGVHPLDGLFVIASTDWDLLKKAVNAVPTIVRSRCYDVAILHSFEHQSGDLSYFWTQVAETFR
jgi:hypothetical protein